MHAFKHLKRGMVRALPFLFLLSAPGLTQASTFAPVYSNGSVASLGQGACSSNTIYYPWGNNIAYMTCTGPNGSGYTYPTLGAFSMTVTNNGSSLQVSANCTQPDLSSCSASNTVTVGGTSFNIYMEVYAGGIDVSNAYTAIGKVTPVAVNGACSSPATAYTCTAGTSTNNVNGATAYTWTCAGSGGGTDASCSELKPSNTPPTATLSAFPTTIASGQSSTLTWSSSGATSCTAAGGFTTGGATSGTASVSPPVTSSYQIYCDNSGGRTYSNIVTVTVSPPPTVSINAAPSRVLSGSTTAVSWNASNVNTCTITRNGILWKSLTANFLTHALSGSAPDSITSQTVYVMHCNGSAGATAVATQIVNVVQSFQQF